MKRLTTYCDTCGRPKGESNQWYVATVTSGAFACYLWERAPRTRRHSWRTIHLCSQSCAVKAMIHALDPTSDPTSEKHQ